MGFCTFMKTVEVTRHKEAGHGAHNASTIQIAREILKREGIRGINKGVNAVAVRQLTNWGSRIGISRIVESTMRGWQKEEERGKPLSALQRIMASTIGGALSTWNQPM